MSRRLVLALSVPLLLASCRWPFAPDPVIAGSDTFGSNLNSYAAYGAPASTWSIVDHQLQATGVLTQAVLIRGGTQMLDGWVETESDHLDEGGLVLRFADNDNYYLLALRDDGSLLDQRNLEFFRRRDGHFQILTPPYGKDISWPRGVVRKVRFEAVGSLLKVYVDGLEVYSVDDPDPLTAKGRVGVRYSDVPEQPGSDFARYRSLRWHEE